MNGFEITAKQKDSISNYKRLGIDIEILQDNIVKITQSRLVNGIILNQKELHERAREVFPSKEFKIIPVVFSLKATDITNEWILVKMNEFGIKRKDLIKQLAINRETLNDFLSGKRELTKPIKVAFFYYFLSYELGNSIKKIGHYQLTKS